MTNFEGDIVEDRRMNNYTTEISDDNAMFQSALSLSRTLMSTFIKPSAARMHMKQ